MKHLFVNSCLGVKKKVGEGLKYCTLAMVFNHFTVKGIIRKPVHQSRGAEKPKEVLLHHLAVTSLTMSFIY